MGLLSVAVEFISGNVLSRSTCLCMIPARHEQRDSQINTESGNKKIKRLKISEISFREMMARTP